VHCAIVFGPYQSTCFSGLLPPEDLGDAVRRREFIALVGSAAVAWPFAAMAQEAGRTYRLGFVSAAPRDEAWYTAFFEELRGLGFVEDQNLTVIGRIWHS
jgi:putative tryptophan/tyrosine transport system substrate-binding protein